jgi:predicted transcriptional regulator
LDKDAISAGVSKIGGLFSTAEVRVLICYILSAINEPIPGTLLGEVLHYEGIANIFEVSDSLASLAKTGHIMETDKGDGSFVVTDKGRDIVMALKTSLSLVVKERAYAAVTRMLARYKNAQETEFNITKEGERMYLTCTALDKEFPFMSIKLLVADEDQARYIKEKFLDNASEIYSKLIEMLTRKDT